MTRQARKGNGRMEVPSVNRMPTNTVYLGAKTGRNDNGRKREVSEKVRNTFRLMKPLDEAAVDLSLSAKKVFGDDEGMPKDPLMADMEKGARQMDAMGMKRPGAGGW